MGRAGDLSCRRHRAVDGWDTEARATSSWRPEVEDAGVRRRGVLNDREEPVATGLMSCSRGPSAKYCALSAGSLGHPRSASPHAGPAGPRLSSRPTPSTSIGARWSFTQPGRLPAAAAPCLPSCPLTSLASSSTHLLGLVLNRALRSRPASRPSSPSGLLHPPSCHLRRTAASPSGGMGSEAGHTLPAHLESLALPSKTAEWNCPSYRCFALRHYGMLNSF